MQLDCLRQVGKAFSRPDDFALSGQEAQNAALLLCERRTDRRSHFIFEPAIGFSWPVDDLHRETAALAFDNRAIIEQLCNCHSVQRSRHGKDAQIFPQRGLHIEGKGEAKIAFQIALVKLIEEHTADPGKFGIIQHHAREDALGDEFNTGVGASAAVHAYSIADPAARPFANQTRHVFGCCPCRQSPRFKHDQSLALVPGFIEQCQRHAAGLAGPGRRNKDRRRFLAQG